MKSLKHLILNLYHLPALCRTCFRHQQGGWYIFRNESDEFLKYLMYKVQRITHKEGTDFESFMAQAKAEINTRELKKQITTVETSGT